MSLHPGEQKLIDDVEQYGWHVVMVSSRVGEPYEPPFAYTVGLQKSFGWAELLCYGLADKTMARMLNNAVAELHQGGTAPEVGMMLSEVIARYECRLSPMAFRHYQTHLGFAGWFAHYCGKTAADIRCLQVLWPDRNGKFPDETDCAPELKKVQPMLAE